MGLANISLAERFLPLVYCGHNDRSICYQNVIDLQETGLLEKLGSLREAASLLVHRTDMFPPPGSEARNALSAFTECLRVLSIMAQADSFSQSGDGETFDLFACKGDQRMSLPTRYFLLNGIETALNGLCLQLGGHSEICADTCRQALALLAHDHVMEFYRTLEVLPGNPHEAEGSTSEVIVHIPRAKDGKMLSEKERLELFSYTLEMLKLYCYPGIHRTGFAASLTPVVTMGSIGVMKYAQNRGFEMLQQVLREQCPDNDTPSEAVESYA